MAISKDFTDKCTQTDIDDNKGLSVLSYMPLLVIIPLITGRESKFVRFHTNQGLLLTLAGFGGSALLSLFNKIAGIEQIVLVMFIFMAAVLAVFSCIGIVNVLRGKAKELPFIGGFRFFKDTDFD